VIRTAAWLPPALLAIAALSACSKDSPGATRHRFHLPFTKTNDSAGGAIDLSTTSYSPSKLSAVGSLSGTNKLDGPPPPATIPLPFDQNICGKTAEAPVSATSKGLSNAVVWIADVKTGKDFPIDKRTELSSDNCALNPRVQAVVVGTTVDVFNDDKLIHRLIFTRMGTNDTLTKMPFFNTGQVVASERLAKDAGMVEVRCVQHPWTRGYIAVFDQPYFAVTDDDGSFTIDSLPPGTYKMMVWHEGAANPVEQQVQVAAGGKAKVDLAIRVGAARSSPPDSATGAAR
jgi:hypothetical protein